MKAKETRKRLIDELSSEFNIENVSSNKKESHYNSFEDKPRMFEPKKNESVLISDNSVSEHGIRGIGFSKSNDTLQQKNVVQQEIYNMKDFIKSGPEYMQTISYDTKIVKAQMALVKRKEWQDILFGDIDWFKPINIGDGIKKLFKF